MIRYIVSLILAACLCAGSAQAQEKTAVPQNTQAAGAAQAGHTATPAAQPETGEEAKENDEVVQQEDLPLSETEARQKAEDKERKQEVVRHAWEGQLAMLQSFRESAEQMEAKVEAMRADIEEHFTAYEGETRRLTVLASTYKDWSNPMEAVSRSITHALADIREFSAPLREGRDELKRRLDRVRPIEENLQERLGKGGQGDDLKLFETQVGSIRKKLSSVLARYELALAPFETMVGRLEETQKTIVARLPELWKSYYLQPPLPWLSEKTWHNFSKRMSYAVAGLKLRLPVELPITKDQWRMAGLRFAISIALSLALGVIMYHRWFRGNDNATARHLFFVSLPWLLFGISLLVSSISATGDVFRVFLALGNLCAILGITMLAWDLRRFSHPEVSIQMSPLLRLMPLTFAAYILLYLPLIRPILLVAWLACLVATIIWRRFWPPLSIAPLQLEEYVRSADGAVLWICLFLSLAGLHIISMIIYLLFTSLCLAIQVSLGGIGRINYLNEHLPTQEVHAALASLLVALAAPLMLVTSLVSVLLWVGTLPGGMVLMQEYFFKSVRIGSTQFNLLSILAIISFFFLTRAAVIMGTRFLKRLQGQGLNIDASLIPPAQTAFTYTAWAIFGLFVLRSLGMELSNLAMVAGGLSVGIGFGMQTIVSNFISGLLLIFGRMLQVGDVVEVAGVTGRVRKISVRDTMVETYDNALIYIPNSEFISKQLINWTRNNPTVRINIPVGVAYGTNTALVIKTLTAIANAHSGVLKYPAPSVAFQDFGDNTLNFALYCWVAKYDDRISTATELRLAIEKEFTAKRIEIAFPQVDVHVKELPSHKQGSSSTGVTRHSVRHRKSRSFRTRQTPSAPKEESQTP
ncbi:MAG: mechanosensitive ion channel [Desulfovibrio sp.]|nr:mechanosensitive ion channel [Desulfovibrio sp.]